MGKGGCCQKAARLVKRPVKGITCKGLPEGRIMTQGSSVWKQRGQHRRTALRAGLYYRELPGLAYNPGEYGRELPRPSGLHLKTEEKDGLFLVLIWKE